MEGINHHRASQLLCSQEITLSQRGLFKQLVQDLKAVYSEYRKQIVPKSRPLLTNKYKDIIPVGKLVVAALDQA
ncbi:hypothetical protein [Trichormus azollae]|uniref:hypothetical protein n=1 Tax=Trichormus azollae TaxID=1164 RepID=UPI00325CC83E